MLVNCGTKSFALSLKACAHTSAYVGAPTVVRKTPSNPSTTYPNNLQVRTRAGNHGSLSPLIREGTTKTAGSGHGQRFQIKTVLPANNM